MPLSNVCPLCKLNGGYHALNCPNQEKSVTDIQRGEVETKVTKPVETLEDLRQYIGANFTVTYPDASGFSPLNYAFFLEKQEGRDVEAQLVDRMKHEFDLLKSMGAKVIAVDQMPRLFSGDMTIAIEARFFALTASGEVLRTGYETPEEDRMNEIEPSTPALNPIAGYDLIEGKEDAILLCARIIHATVEAMNKAHNETTLTWERSRDSIISGVKRSLENPNETAEENHNAWMKYRASEGWVYGPLKDGLAKTHPCMVPYQALGPFQQSKDAVFHAIVRTFFGL